MKQWMFSLSHTVRPTGIRRGSYYYYYYYLCVLKGSVAGNRLPIPLSRKGFNTGKTGASRLLLRNGPHSPEADVATGQGSGRDKSSCLPE